VRPAKRRAKMEQRDSEAASYLGWYGGWVNSQLAPAGHNWLGVGKRRAGVPLLSPGLQKALLFRSFQETPLRVPLLYLGPCRFR
jgi:hypothetical protein